MAELRLRVITPRRVVVDETVLEVSAPGTVGEFGVLPEHIAFLGSLECGRLSYRTGHERVHLAVRGGFAEVTDDVMTVLVEAAERGDEVDVGRAEAERQEAERQLAKLSPYDPEYEAVAEAHRWALARLAAARPPGDGR